MSDSRKAKRPSIYLNPPLQRVVNRMPDDISLSQRLGQICERYEMITRAAPELTERDRMIIGNALSGSVIEPLLIMHLDAEVQDAAGANSMLDDVDQSELNDLADRVREMSAAERVAIIESLGM